MTGNALDTAGGRAAATRFHAGHALGLAALVTPFAQAYSWPIVTPIMALAALGAVVAVRGRIARPPLMLVGLLALLAAYSAVTGIWGLSTNLALKTTLTVVATAVPGLILVAEARRLDAAERAWFEVCLVAGFVIGLVNLQIIVVTKGELFAWLRQVEWVHAIFGPPAPVSLVTFDTQMSLVSLMVWPAIGVVRRRYGLAWAVVLAIAAFVVTLQGLSGTAKVACMVGFAAIVFVWLLPRWSAAIAGAVLVAWIALAPVLYQSKVMQWGTEVAAHVSERVSNSILHRVAIWEFAADRIRDRPLLGWGMGNSRIMPGGHEETKEGTMAKYGGLELMPLHPHNAALQLWLELGLPGALLGMVFVGWIARAIGRLADPAERALMLALLGAIAVNAASGYNLWHTWWMTFLWLAAAFSIAAMARLKPAASPAA